MEIDTVLLARKFQLIGRAETTTGTAISPLEDADGGYIVRDLVMTPSIDFNPRPQQGGLGSEKGVPGAKGGRCAFTLDLYGKGTSGIPDWAALLLPGCCLDASGATYTVDTTPQTTLTLANYRAGRRRLISGAMGNFEMTVNHTNPVALAFDFQGIWNTPVDASALSPTYDTQLPIVGASTLTFNSTTVVCANMRFNLGANVIMRPDVASSTGYRSAWITGVNPTITIDPEATALSTRDWYDLFVDGTEFAWNCVLGSGAGNVITFSASACQINAPPGDADRDGLDIDEVTMQINRSTLSIVFG